MISRTTLKKNERGMILNEERGMDKKTTCCNYGCPLIDRQCTFNIWKAHLSPAPCRNGKEGFGNYLSQKQSIYKRYREKAEKRNEKPMSPRVYFEEW